MALLHQDLTSKAHLSSLLYLGNVGYQQTLLPQSSLIVTVTDILAYYSKESIMTLRSLLHNSHLTIRFAQGKLDHFIAMKITFAIKQHGPSTLGFDQDQYIYLLKIVTLVEQCGILVAIVITGFTDNDSDKHFSYLLQSSMIFCSLEFKHFKAKFFNETLFHSTNLKQKMGIKIIIQDIEIFLKTVVISQSVLSLSVSFISFMNKIDGYYSYLVSAECIGCSAVESRLQVTKAFCSSFR